MEVDLAHLVHNIFALKRDKCKSWKDKKEEINKKNNIPTIWDKDQFKLKNNKHGGA